MAAGGGYPRFFHYRRLGHAVCERIRISLKIGLGNVVLAQRDNNPRGGEYRYRKTKRQTKKSSQPRKELGHSLGRVALSG